MRTVLCSLALLVAGCAHAAPAPLSSKLLASCYHELWRYTDDLGAHPLIGPLAPTLDQAWLPAIAVLPHQRLAGREGFLVIDPDGVFFGEVAAGGVRRRLRFPPPSNVDKLWVDIDPTGTDFSSGSWEGAGFSAWESPRPPRASSGGAGADLLLERVDGTEVRTLVAHDLARVLATTHDHFVSHPKLARVGSAPFLRFLDECSEAGEGEVRLAAATEEKKFFASEPVVSATPRPPTSTPPVRVRWVPVSYAEELSRQRGLPILYVFSETYCGPCQNLAREVFADGPAADWINGTFVPVHVLEGGEMGLATTEQVADLRARFGVGGFPTLVVAPSRFSGAATWIGFRDKASVLEFLRFGWKQRLYPKLEEAMR